MNDGNPNWQPFLDVLPESLHSIVTPVLKEWDLGVQKKLEEVRAEYEPYKAYEAFVKEDIDPQFVYQSVQLADAIRENPSEVINRIDETYNLGYTKPGEAASTNSTDSESDYSSNEDPLYDGMDIENHPKFRALSETLTKLESGFTERQKQEQEEAAVNEFEDYLDGLEEKHGNIDRILVTAYMSQGMDGDDAVNAYKQALARHLDPEQLETKQQQQEQGSNSATSPPVVLDGTASGSGVPNEPIDFASMSKQDTNSYVEKLLQQAAQNSQ